MLLRNLIRLVPRTDVHGLVPTYVKVVGLNVRTVMVADIHQANQFHDELAALASEMLAAPIRIDLNCLVVVQGLRSAVRVLARIRFVASFERVAAKVELAGFDIDHKGRMMMHADGRFHAITLTMSLDSRGELRLALL